MSPLMQKIYNIVDGARCDEPGGTMKAVMAIVEAVTKAELELYKPLRPVARMFFTGGYMGKCTDCGETMSGVDKRQPWCKPCVDKWNEEHKV